MSMWLEKSKVLVGFIGSLSNPLLGQYPGLLCQRGGALNKDPTVLLDGRPPLIRLIVCWTNSEIVKLGPYEKKKHFKNATK